jgi:hypothetical protein
VRLLDAMAALALTAWALVLNTGARAPALAAMTLAVAWVRTVTLVVLGIEIVGVVGLTKYLQWPQGIAFLIASYSATLYSDKRAVVTGLLVFAGAWLLAFGGNVTIASGVAPFLLLVPVWLAGSGMRRRQHRAEV